MDTRRTGGDGDEPSHSRAAAATVGAAPGGLAQDTAASLTTAAIPAIGVAHEESGSRISPAFDAHHPPEKALIDDCVHCGFCLPTCPTYLLWGEEMDSPRGRIYLMNEAVEGEPMTDAMVRHWDLCLGCLACVTACPSGVQYDKLLEATRAQVERRYPRGRMDRLFRALIFALFPYPRRLRVLAAPLGPYQRYRVGSLLHSAGFLQRLPGPLRAMEALMPDLSTSVSRRKIPPVTPARGGKRARVGVLEGCVQRAFFGQVNAATVRVLAADGCEVVSPAAQGCCGALSIHSGRAEEGMRFARQTIDAFEAEGLDAIVVNSAGCGAAMKEYGYLLRDDPGYARRAENFSAMVRDVSEFVQELGSVAPRHPLPLTVAYHDACHLAHGQGIRQQPRQSLLSIPGLTLREIGESEICCGSAGVYNLVEPEPAAALGERKARNVLETGAELLVASNPGCTLQIHASLARLGAHLPMAHPIELLDASIRGESLESFLHRKDPS